MSTVKQSIINAIRNRVKVAFALSQSVVPVDTGKLKKSGSEKNIPNGAEIKYISPYASDVERGLTDRWVDVRGYRRKGIWIKEYRRWQPSREPAKFIENSLHDSFKMFATVLDNELRAKFSNVRRG
jgi:hypothetical protein